VDVIITASTGALALQVSEVADSTQCDLQNHLSVLPIAPDSSAILPQNSLKRGLKAVMEVKPVIQEES
jgi:hypothetical protein